MERNCELTAERLRELFAYDPATGVFVRIKGAKGPKPKDGKAGCLCTSGHRQIMVDGVLYMAHRMAWLYVTGAWPAQDIDHRNGNRDDNTWKNLRDTSAEGNLQNQREAHANNDTGFLGVHLHKATGKYRARIRAFGETYSLGLHDTPELAHEAYLAAKRDLHPTCTI